MEKIIITIEDGVTKFLVNEQTQDLVEDGTVRRASHVEPVNIVLRRVFHALRGMFGEKGWMADFTRKWPCLWQINLEPIGGPVLADTFYKRQNAIDCEVDYLNENFI